MTQKLIFSVFGATGAQGGGVVRSLLARRLPHLRVRALTRVPTSAPAQVLADLGAEVVRADLDDAQTLGKALAGSDAVFAVTNFWEHGSPERELLQARHLAHAAQQVRVPHLVWSTLEDTRRYLPLEDERVPTLMQHYKVPHLDAKGAANALFRASGVPTTLLYTSFYWDNLIHFGLGPKPGTDGMLQFVLPMGDKPLPGIAAADIGACAAELMLRGPQRGTQSLGIAGEHLTGAQMAAQMAEALGRPVRHVDMDRAQYAALGFPGADELANMFAFKREFNDEYRARRSVAASRVLHPGMLDFRQWLARHACEVPL
ncbi:MAG: NmrA/HSCARG family protein [Burkholderiales bacterium]|nr:NmrA/HSCARG family protein [Burkholderiales bacterium]